MDSQLTGKAKGGKAAAAMLTPKERKERAQKAASARWDKDSSQTTIEVPKAICDGVLKLGDGVEIPCAVLPDGTRLLSERGITKALGGKGAALIGVEKKLATMAPICQFICLLRT